MSKLILKEANAVPFTMSLIRVFIPDLALDHILMLGVKSIHPRRSDAIIVPI